MPLPLCVSAAAVPCTHTTCRGSSIHTRCLIMHLCCSLPCFLICRNRYAIAQQCRVHIPPAEGLALLAQMMSRAVIHYMHLGCSPPRLPLIRLLICADMRWFALTDMPLPLCVSAAAVLCTHTTCRGSSTHTRCLIMHLCCSLPCFLTCRN